MPPHFCCMLRILFFSPLAIESAWQMSLHSMVCCKRSSVQAARCGFRDLAKKTFGSKAQRCRFLLVGARSTRRAWASPPDMGLSFGVFEMRPDSSPHAQRPLECQQKNWGYRWFTYFHIFLMIRYQCILFCWCHVPIWQSRDLMAFKQVGSHKIGQLWVFRQERRRRLNMALMWLEVCFRCWVLGRHNNEWLVLHQKKTRWPEKVGSWKLYLLHDGGPRKDQVSFLQIGGEQLKLMGCCGSNKKIDRVIHERSQDSHQAIH